MYINHSGGAEGADMMWENEGRKYGIETIAYSFRNHVQYSKNPKILTVAELNEGFEHVMIANATLKRNPYSIRLGYVRNLLSRNWYQVLNAEAVFAVGTFLGKDTKVVSGGTGWAVQMGRDNHKPVFFFDQKSVNWYKDGVEKFEKLDYIPKITVNFAGVGTRELDSNGEQAIRDVLKNSLGL